MRKVICQIIPTGMTENPAQEIKIGNYTPGNEYDMSIAGWGLYSVTDDKGSKYVFSTEQAQKSFDIC